MKIDLGSGRSALAGYVTVDKEPAVMAGVTADIEALGASEFISKGWWGNVDEIRAHHILEHVRPENKVRVMRLIYDLLKPGGIVDIELPLAGTPQFWQDPTHMSGWVRESFWYFTRGDRFGEAFARRCPECRLFDVERPAEIKDGWILSITMKKPL